MIGNSFFLLIGWFIILHLCLWQNIDWTCLYFFVAVDVVCVHGIETCYRQYIFVFSYIYGVYMYFSMEGACLRPEKKQDLWCSVDVSQEDHEVKCKAVMSSVLQRDDRQLLRQPIRAAQWSDYSVVLFQSAGLKWFSCFLLLICFSSFLIQ